jgi:hypothetical protein
MLVGGVDRFRDSAMARHCVSVWNTKKMPQLWRTTFERIRLDFQRLRTCHAPHTLSGLLVEARFGWGSPNIAFESIPGIQTSGQKLFFRGLDYTNLNYAEIQMPGPATTAGESGPVLVATFSGAIATRSNDANQMWFPAQYGIRRSMLTFGAASLGDEYVRLAKDAGRTLRGITNELPTLPGPKYFDGDDAALWFSTLFELAWRKIPGSPLVAEKFVGSGNSRCRLESVPALRQTNFPADLAQHIPDPLTHWFSDLQDLLSASMSAIDIILNLPDALQSDSNVLTAQPHSAMQTPSESGSQFPGQSINVKANGDVHFHAPISQSAGAAPAAKLPLRRKIFEWLKDVHGIIKLLLGIVITSGAIWVAIKSFGRGSASPGNLPPKTVPPVAASSP